MPSNKNQHFVPKTYLKGFSLDGRSISVFIASSGKGFHGAPIKNQCSKDYFYGKNPSVEGILQGKEGDYSKHVSIIKTNHRVIPEETKDFMLSFWIVQNSRVDSYVSTISEIFPEVLDGFDHGEDLSTINFGEELVAVSSGIGNHLISDLRFLIIKNDIKKTRVPFVTSDNPAVKTNSYQFSKLGRNWENAMISSGAIVALPISSDLCMVAFDRDIYSLKSDLASCKDVLFLNSLQLSNCGKCIFHDGSFTDDNFLSLSKASKRIKKRYRVREIKASYCGVAIDDIVHSQILHPAPSIFPDFIERKSRGFVYETDSLIRFVRKNAFRDFDGPGKRGA